MATLYECLRDLPADLMMRDLSAVRDEVATVAEHLQRVRHDEDGYELRNQPCNYGRNELRVVGLIHGPAVFREVK